MNEIRYQKNPKKLQGVLLAGSTRCMFAKVISLNISGNSYGKGLP